MIRTKAKFVDVSPATLFDVLHDVDYKRVWDKHVLDVTEIGHIDHQNNVTYFSSENARFVFYLPPTFTTTIRSVLQFGVQPRWRTEILLCRVRGGYPWWARQKNISSWTTLLFTRITRQERDTLEAHLISQVQCHKRLCFTLAFWSQNVFEIRPTSNMVKTFSMIGKQLSSRIFDSSNIKWLWTWLCDSLVSQAGFKKVIVVIHLADFMSVCFDECRRHTIFQ